MSPRQERLDTLLGQEPAVSKKSKHLVTEEELGLVGVDVGDGMPRPLTQENAACDDRMDVGIPLE
jgi:hypothetical protein